EATDSLFCDLLLNDPVPLKIVFAFRDDYLARLAITLFSRIPNLMDQAVRLALPTVDVVQTLVHGPFIPSAERGLPPGHFRNQAGEPDELSETLAQKFAEGIRSAQPSGLVNLSEVQLLCLTLWQEPKRRDELLRTHNSAAVLRKILVSVAMTKLSDLALSDRIRAIVLLSNLVTEQGTRDVVSEENLIGETRRNPLMWF